jgi:hypothetical protein
MKVFHIAVAMALLTGPVYAQTLIQSFDSRTPQQKADDELKEKNFKESQRKTPEADTTTTTTKTSVDAWGNVRSTDATKTSASKSSASKSSASKNSKAATSVKPQTKTGTDAD